MSTFHKQFYVTSITEEKINFSFDFLFIIKLNKKLDNDQHK